MHTRSQVNKGIERTSDMWGSYPLPQQHLEYAICDARASYMVWAALDTPPMEEETRTDTPPMDEEAVREIVDRYCPLALALEASWPSLSADRSPRHAFTRVCVCVCVCTGTRRSSSRALQAASRTCTRS